MARVIRDIAVLRNRLLTTVHSAGPSGMPLLQALQKATERQELMGADYSLALQLRREGMLMTFPGLGSTKRIVHKDFANGQYDPAQMAAPLPPPPPTKHRARPKRSPNPATLLVTIQYGRNESVTLSFDQARQVYRQLSGMFGHE